MKEPRRLLSHGATDFERQLLRAVVNERPSALLRSRMQRGLGLVGPLAWASNVKAMFASAASKLSGTMVLGGLVVVGAVTAVAVIPGSNTEPVASGSHVERSVEDRTAPAALPSEPAQERATSLSEPAVRTSPPVPAVVAPVASAEPPQVGPEGAPSETKAAAELEDAEGDGQLREEIALIDAARAALQTGDRERARERLQVYHERFPDGILRREAKVLSRRAEPKRAKH
jgi:hypothetical protein